LGRIATASVEMLDSEKEILTALFLIGEALVEIMISLSD